MSQEPNWVQRRAARDRALDIGAPAFWNSVRAALQDACDSYNEHYVYDATRKKVECYLENGHRARIAKLVPADHTTTFQDSLRDVIVTFEKSIPVIRIARTTGASEAFYIHSDEKEAFAVKGAEPDRISPDEICRLILEPLLFEEGRTHPIFKAQ